jgi:hypothetical protein
MADAFTDMHQQLNGKIEKQPVAERVTRRAVEKHAKKHPNRLEVEVELLDILGLAVAP